MGNGGGMGEKAKKKPGSDDTEALKLRIAELERTEDLLRRQLTELQKAEEDYVKGEEKLRNRVEELEQAEAEYRTTVDKLERQLASLESAEANYLKAEEALTDSERRHRETFENSPMGMYRTTPKGKVLMANPALLTMMGFSSFEEVADRDLEKEGHAPGHPRDDFKDRMEMQGEVHNFETAWIKKDGTPINVLEHARAVRDAEGKMLYYEGAVEDLTQKKLSEKAAAVKEDYWKLLLDSAPITISIFDREGKVTFESPSIERLLGYKPEELLGTSAFDTIHPEDREPVIKEFMSAVGQEGKSKNVEMRLRHKDGSWRVFEAISRNLFHDPLVNGFVVIGRDISVRKQAENEVRKSRDRLEKVFDGVTDGILVLGMDFRILQCNYSAEKMFRYKKEELIGQPNKMLMQRKTELKEIGQSWMRKIMDQGVSQGDVDLVRSDGTDFPATVTATIFQGSDGKPAGIVMAIRDLTVQRNAESELQEKQRVLTTLMGNLPGMAYRCRNDELWTMEFVSDGCLELTGYDPSELILNRKISYMELNHPEDRDKGRDDIAVAIKEGQPFQLTYRIITKDGTEKWVWEKGRGVKDSGGKVVALEGFITDITNRRRMEEAYSQSEALLQTAVESMPFEFFAIGKDGRYFLQNSACRKNRGNVIGKRPEDIQASDADKKLWAENNRRAFAGEILHEDVVMDVKGERVHFTNIIAPIRFGDQIRGILGINIDITERRDAIEALEKSEDRFRTMFEQGPLGMVIVGKGFRFLQANGMFCKMTGYTEDELRKISFQEITHPDDKLRDLESVNRLIKGEIPVYNTEKRYVRKDGSILWGSTTFTFIKGRAGDLGISLAMIEDITKRKMAEEALRESEEKYRLIVEHMQDGVYTMDTNTNITFVSPSLAKRSGIPLEKYLKMNILDIVQPEHHEVAKKTFEKTMAGEATEPYIIKYKSSSNTIRTIEVATTPIFSSEGKVIGALGISRDLTERLLMEEALRESEEKYRNLAEQSPNMIFINKRGRVVFANKKCEELMGYTRDEFYAPSFDFRNITAPEFRDVVMRAYQKHQAGQDVEPYEYAIIAKDGHRLTTILTPKVIRYEGELAIMGTITDITERKKMEDAVNASLREKEALLREVHHRVKNNLQVICSLLSLQSRHVTDPSALAAFKESESRVRSMALVHEKLYMTRDFGLIDFATYVRSLAPELLRSYKVEQDTVILKMELDDVRLGIDVAIPLGMMMNELVSNCLKHAFPEGRKGEIAIELKSGTGGSVMLSVADNGIGFPDGVDFRAVRSMGMEMVITLVEQLEGSIEMERGGGTKFTVRFSIPAGAKEGGHFVR